MGGGGFAAFSAVIRIMIILMNRMMDMVMTLKMNIVIDTLEIPTLNITAGNRISIYLSTSFFDILIFF